MLSPLETRVSLLSLLAECSEIRDLLASTSWEERLKTIATISRQRKGFLIELRKRKKKRGGSGGRKRGGGKSKLSKNQPSITALVSKRVWRKLWPTKLQHITNFRDAFLASITLRNLRMKVYIPIFSQDPQIKFF